ncbi:MAG: MFS transporter [Methanoregula sp.]|nr:MFS transporter [Methanoregula sp.]
MEARTEADAPEPYWLLNLALMSLGALVSSFSVSSITVSLPLIAADLHTSTGFASASVIVYLLVLSGLFLFFGKLGDVWGYRRVFLAGFVVFTLGSFLCGVSVTVNQLILFRIVQAAGAAMIASVGAPFVTRHIPKAWEGRGFAYVSGAAVLGVIMGPTVGMAVTDLLTWNWVFLANVPLGIAIMAIGWFTLPGNEDTSRGRRFDLVGACLFSCATVTIVLAISSVHAFGITSLMTAGLVMFTFAFWTLAIVYESATEDPAFEISLFRNRHFTNANISFFLLKMVFNGPVFLFPFYLHLVLGYTYELTSLIVIVPGVVMLLVCPGIGSLTDRFSNRALSVIGAAGAAAVYLFFAGFTASITLIPAVLALVILGLARGVFLVPNTKLIMDHSPADMKGAASGVMKSLGNTGIILGMVIFQIAFSETLLAGEAAVQYHDPFTIPMPAITAGFRVAFLLAAGLSLAALFFAWRARDVVVDTAPEDS